MYVSKPDLSSHAPFIHRRQINNIHTLMRSVGYRVSSRRTKKGILTDVHNFIIILLELQDLVLPKRLDCEMENSKYDPEILSLDPEGDALCRLTAIMLRRSTTNKD